MRTDLKYRGVPHLVVFVGLLFTSGCTRNYYYGGMPSCGPTSVIPGAVQYGSAVQYGNVCEVPTQVVGGASSAVSQSSDLSAPILSTGKPPRVVISEPLGSSNRTRYNWRPSDPENSLATTKVEGGVSDSSTVR